MTHTPKNMIFVLYTYALCGILIFAAAMIGMPMAGRPESNGAVVQLIMLVIAWTPTLVLLTCFKKFYPETSIKRFYKKAFQERLNIRLLLVVTAVQTIISVGAPGMVALSKGVSYNSVMNVSLQSLLMSIIITLLSGAAGEESGWRGFLQHSLEKRFSVIKASIIVGFIWAFWHSAVLVTTSGFLGGELVQYVFLYVVTIVSVAVMIGICYSRCKNLLVPMWLHFMFNFIAPMLTVSMLDFMKWYAVFYVVAAVGYGIWFIRTNKVQRDSNRRNVSPGPESSFSPGTPGG